MSACECIVSANELLAAHSALLARVRSSQTSRRRQLHALPSPPLALLNVPFISSPQSSPPSSPPSSPTLPPKPKHIRADLPPAKRARVARYQNYVPEEETIRNDYSQRYVDGGEWPQNWVLGADPEHRFEEYPKQQKLLALKKASVNAHALPPTYLPFSALSTLHPSKFDVILIDPPFSSSFSWSDLQDLPIPALAADPSYVLMWVGSGAGDGLERGREIMAKWGFRRCEDIVWVKTNKTTNHGPGTDPPTTSLLTRTKQHCLMGIRGTVRRSTDSWFVHCNVDTDVLIWEGSPTDPTLKPPETYTLIENFCLGLRRLEIFGRARTLRRGWVTALAEGEEERVEQGWWGDVDMADTNAEVGDNDGGGEELMTPVKWEREAWEAKMKEMASGGRCVVPMTPEIDALRPKSPVRGSSGNHPPGPPMNAGMAMNAGMGGGGMAMGGMGNLGGIAGLPNPPMAMPMSSGRPGGFQQHQHQQHQQHQHHHPGAHNMNAMGMGQMGMGNMGNMNMGVNVGRMMPPPMMNVEGMQMGWPGEMGMGGAMGMGGMSQHMGNMGNLGGMSNMNNMNNMANMGNLGGLPNLGNLGNLGNMGMQNMGGMPHMQHLGQPGMQMQGMNMGGGQGMWDGSAAMGGDGGMLMGGMGMGMGGMPGMGGMGQWG